MATIMVKREWVEKLLGTGSARHSKRTLAREIGGLIARKLFKQRHEAINLDKVVIDKTWDGDIEITFVGNTGFPDASIVSAARNIERFFQDPEANSDL